MTRLDLLLSQHARAVGQEPTVEVQGPPHASPARLGNLADLPPLPRPPAPLERTLLSAQARAHRARLVPTVLRQTLGPLLALLVPTHHQQVRRVAQLAQVVMSAQVVVRQ